MTAPDRPGVHVPHGAETTVFNAVVLYASDRARDGATLTPQLRTFIRELHLAASHTPTTPTSSEGSSVGESEILGAHEVADLLGCTRRWATELLSSGRINASRAGRSWVTTQRDLDHYRFEETRHGQGKGAGEVGEGRHRTAQREAEDTHAAP